MSNTYTWKIVGLDCYSMAESQTNVIFNARWIAKATDGTNIVSIYGSQDLTYAAKSDFIDYVNLTEAKVLEWVKDALSAEKVSAIESSLDNRIKNLISPPVVSLPLPWAKNA